MAAGSSPFEETRLSNGLRIVMEAMPTVRSAAAGFLANTGARDETPELAGVSHFLEHMCFKGTPKRTWHEITVDFDEMGSHYNAFTSKERTFYYGWVPAREIHGQIELLADMMRSSLPSDEFDVEKGVILEEIAMGKDSIEHVAWDLIHEHIYSGHSLSRPVLGTEESIKALTRDRMAAYFQERYSPSNLVLIVVGNIDPREVVATAERICGDWPVVETSIRQETPGFHGGRVVEQADRFSQQAVGLIYPGPAAGHADCETARALASILGGGNSRFYWNIVQTGLAPHAGVYWLGYIDCGMMMLDGLCMPDKAEEFAAAMRQQAEEITREGVATEELERVKNKRRTSLAVEAEAAYHRLVQVAEDLCDYGRPRTVAERLADVESVTVQRISEYLSDWPIIDEGVFLGLGPRRWPEERMQ